MVGERGLRATSFGENGKTGGKDDNGALLNIANIFSAKVAGIRKIQAVFHSKLAQVILHCHKLLNAAKTGKTYKRAIFPMSIYTLPF